MAVGFLHGKNSMTQSLAALALDLKGLWLTYDYRAHRAIQKEKASWPLEKALPPAWPSK